MHMEMKSAEPMMQCNEEHSATGQSSKLIFDKSDATCAYITFLIPGKSQDLLQRRFSSEMDADDDILMPQAQKQGRASDVTLRTNEGMVVDYHMI